MEYIYTAQFKDKRNNTISEICLGDNLGCLKAAYNCLKDTNLTEYLNNSKIVKVWILLNNSRQITYNINEFK